MIKRHPVIDTTRRSLVLAALTGTGVSMFPLVRSGETAFAATTPAALHLQLRIIPDQVHILPGQPTAIWRYEGKVLDGDPRALQQAPGSTLPILRLRQGQRIRIDIQNDIPEDTTVHWHGLRVPANMDGQPHFPIGPGGRFTAQFTVIDPPGTYWFHPHTHKRVGFQVHQGLAGLLIIEDTQPTGLPDGPHDLPLVIQDRRFDIDNQLAYIPHGLAGRMDVINGFLGDRILVNGQIDHGAQVAGRPYRLRILNGSNARIYKLAWSDGRPVTIVGTGGGLLPQAIQRPYVTLAPAERRDLWVDFSDVPLGSDIRLVSLEYSAGSVATTQGTGHSRLPAGSQFDVMHFQVTRAEQAGPSLLPILHTTPAPSPLEAVNADQPKRFVLDMNVTRFTINGRLMWDGPPTDEETTVLGTTEVWEFENVTMIPHPMHIHNVQFRILDRHPATGGMSMAGLGWRGLEQGMVDDGWHDTVLVMPGERVRILVNFQDHAGLYMYHCHNLEHEDCGMMRYFLIQDPGKDTAGAYDWIRLMAICAP